MFGLGFQELLIILVIALIIFGPGKLPQIGSGLGKAIRDFKKGVSGEDSDEVAKGEKDAKKEDSKELPR
jgi:sec-independent protein translocase protein TatA